MGTYLWQCCVSPGPTLICVIKDQNRISKFKLGFPVSKYQSMHLGMNFRKACTPVCQVDRKCQRKKFIPQSFSFETKHEPVVNVQTGEPQSRLFWHLVSLSSALQPPFQPNQGHQSFHELCCSCASRPTSWVDISPMLQAAHLLVFDPLSWMNQGHLATTSSPGLSPALSPF